MPPNFYERYNKNGQTAKQVFINTHEKLAKEGGKWLTKTSESCSVVATLVAAVAFTTSTAIPGGPDQNTGFPLLQGRTAFNIFAVASLVALCSSVTALVLFLSILTSRFQEKDFAMDLPRKLLLGLTTLFTSIASILVSFCAGHLFIIEDQLKAAVYPIYAVTLQVFIVQQSYASGNGYGTSAQAYKRYKESSSENSFQNTFKWPQLTIFVDLQFLTLMDTIRGICNFVKTPMKQNSKLVKNPGVEAANSTLFKQLVGSLSVYAREQEK
ncbi:hypothetical protein CR513_62683, partial [Mucuna pruriens]